jgi:fructokinase
MQLWGAIEAGGTKVRCAVARGAGEVVLTRRIATTDPEQTLDAILAFFDEAQAAQGEITAFGVGSFGPLDLNLRSPTYGHILATPKRGWSGTDLVGPLHRRFAKPVAIDTDVNAAALAEIEVGAGRGLRSLAYVTVGTGVGGGSIIAGETVRGLWHPEMGHISVRRDPRDSGFAGVCPFHGDCLEGLVCGPAIRARWGAALDQIDPAREALGIIGGYLGQLAANIALMLCCERIVLGGGVMSGGALLPHIRSSTRSLLNDYLPTDALRGDMGQYITAPGLGEDSGLTGAILLAQRARGDV